CSAWIAGKILIGGADQGKIILIGNGKDDAPVAVLEKISAWIIKFLAHNNMAALNKANIVALTQAKIIDQHMIDPWPCGIDQQLCLNAMTRAGLHILDLNMPQAILTLGCDNAGARIDLRAL